MKTLKWNIKIGIDGNPSTIDATDAPEWKQCWPTASSEGRIYVCQFRHLESPSMRDYYKPGMELLRQWNTDNARMIAAAPEMLSELYRLRTVLLRWGCDTAHPEEIDKINAIIFKADGRS